MTRAQRILLWIAAVTLLGFGLLVPGEGGGRGEPVSFNITKPIYLIAGVVAAYFALRR